MFGNISNADRALWAAHAIETHTRVARTDEDEQTQAKDLVTNVFHYLRLTVGLSGEEARSVIESAVQMAEIEMNEDSDE